MVGGAHVTIFILGDNAEYKAMMDDTEARTIRSGKVISKAGSDAGAGFYAGFESKTKGFGGLLQKLGNEANNFGLPFGNALSKMGSTISANTTKVGGLLSSLQAIGKITVFGGLAAGAAVAVEGVKLWDQYEKALVSFDTVAKNTGTSVASANKELAAQSNVAARLGFDNTDVAQSMANLTMATGSTKTAFGDMSLVMDLARYKNVSLADAADALDHVYGGSTRTLLSWGININVSSGRLHSLQTELQGVQKAQLNVNTITQKMSDGQLVGVAASTALAKAQQQLKDAQTNYSVSLGTVNKILDTLRERTKGAAEAFSKTFAGQVAAARAEMHNFGVSVGHDVVDVIDKLEVVLAHIINWFEKTKFAAIVLGTVIGGPLVIGTFVYLGATVLNLGHFLLTGGEKFNVFGIQAKQAGAANKQLTTSLTAQSAQTQASTDKTTVLTAGFRQQQVAVDELCGSYATLNTAINTQMAQQEALETKILATNADLEFTAATAAPDAGIALEGLGGIGVMGALGVLGVGLLGVVTLLQHIKAQAASTVTGLQAVANWNKPNAGANAAGGLNASVTSLLAQGDPKGAMLVIQEQYKALGHEPKGSVNWGTQLYTKAQAQQRQAMGIGGTTNISSRVALKPRWNSFTNLYDWVDPKTGQVVESTTPEGRVTLNKQGSPIPPGMPGSGQGPGPEQYGYRTGTRQVVGGGTYHKEKDIIDAEWSRGSLYQKELHMTPTQLEAMAAAYQTQQMLNAGEVPDTTTGIPTGTTPVGFKQNVLITAANQMVQTMQQSLQTGTIQSLHPITEYGGLTGGPQLTGPGMGGPGESYMAQYTASGGYKSTSGAFNKMLDEVHTLFSKGLDKQGREILEVYNAELKYYGALEANLKQAALNQDVLNANTQYTDQTAILEDIWNRATQKITDNSSIATAKATKIADAQAGQGQLQADILGERGLYGLALITQEMRVKLDIITNKYTAEADQQSVVVAQTAAAGNAAVAKAKENMDTLQKKSDIPVGKLQTLAALAQKGGTSLASDVASLNLSAKQAGQAELIAKADRAYEQAQAIAQRHNATAQATLAAIQAAAKVAEAKQNKLIDIESAKANTQFAGSGVHIEITGISPTDSNAVASAVSWSLRTKVPK